MGNVFQLNRDSDGKYVYNHAGIDPRDGDSSKFVVFADNHHGMADYVPTTGKNSPNELRVEVVNMEMFVEVSAAITPALWRFVSCQKMDNLMDLAAHPGDIIHNLGMTLTDRNGVRWDATVVRKQGVAPYLMIVVHSESDLEDLMNRLFDIAPQA